MQTVTCYIIYEIEITVLRRLVGTLKTVFDLLKMEVRIIENRKWEDGLMNKKEELDKSAKLKFLVNQKEFKIFDPIRSGAKRLADAVPDLKRLQTCRNMGIFF